MITINQREFLVNRAIDQLTEFVIKDYGSDLPSALKTVYESQVYKLLQDSEGELYAQSPSYIYELLKQEIR